jgi:hypothetical protein
MMVLALFGWVSLQLFFDEITGFTGLVILGVNFNLYWSYWKMSGAPYKDTKAFESVKWLKIVGVFWTLGFTCKFLTILLGRSLYQV